MTDQPDLPDLFVICETREVQEEEVRGFVLARQCDGVLQPWPILVTRKGGQFHAYENACPHDGKTLDGGHGDFLDEEGNFLQCKAHGDLFDLGEGTCFIGPAKGKALTRLAIVIDEGDICLRDAALTDEDGLHLEEPDTHPEVMITSD
ncbi:Rieske (2Fe-2S) protein [Novosphingobium sp. 1949]|uniref:Rieske (2Fe-2S) protein n=1 Tax=Novosphingobium organovorum TaxID=2930092 RepID=A0ABT0BIP4_9SPHN|nr:Rieske (2Fe-2S) protein [Novosphingobium organovorum]MCJ2184838.1 Rieske (2Fe-2S) protein [Novosphingobium organovorum]